MHTLMTKAVKTHAGPVKITCLQFKEQFGGMIEYRAEYSAQDGKVIRATVRYSPHSFVGRDDAYQEAERTLLNVIAARSFREVA